MRNIVAPVWIGIQEQLDLELRLEERRRYRHHSREHLHPQELEAQKRCQEIDRFLSRYVENTVEIETPQYNCDGDGHPQVMALKALSIRSRARLGETLHYWDAWTALDKYE